MKRWFFLLVLCVTAKVSAAAEIRSLVHSGTWSDASTWSDGVVPGGADNVYIGLGAYPISTVSLTQDQSANQVTLGRDSSCSGTLDVGNYRLVVNTLEFGGGGSGKVFCGAGYISAGNIWVNGSNRFGFASRDSARYLRLRNSAQVTTTATGNVANDVYLNESAKLTLGADLNLADRLEMFGNSQLDMGGYSLKAAEIRLEGTGGVQNRGAITATNRLSVATAANQTFDLTAADSTPNMIYQDASGTLYSSVKYLEAGNSSRVATTAAGNVADRVYLNESAKLTLGADLNLSDRLEMFGNSQLDMGGYSLKAAEIRLEGTGGVFNRGAMKATNRMTVANQAFDLAAVDSTPNIVYQRASGKLFSSVGALEAGYASHVTTTATGSVTGRVYLNESAKLTLGADMNLADRLEMFGNSQLDMGGYSLKAAEIRLEGTGGVLNRGAITATNRLSIATAANQAFDLTAADSTPNMIYQDASGTLYSSVKYLEARNSSRVTTTAAGNVADRVYLNESAKVTLGADLNLADRLEVYGSATLDLGGRSVKAGTVYFASNGGGATAVSNGKTLHANTVHLTSGCKVSLGSEGVISNGLKLDQASSLTLIQAGTVFTGMTLDGNASDGLQLNGNSVLALRFNNVGRESWIFRWRDQAGGNRMGTLQGFIDAGRMTIDAPNGYSLMDREGYTYITCTVPEPSAWVLLGMGLVGLLAFQGRSVCRALRRGELGRS